VAVPPSGFWGWPFNPAHDALLAGIGYWLGIFGLLLTLVGFVITVWQISKVKGAAAAVRDELERVEISMRKYDVAHEISKASYAIIAVKKHIKNSAWIDGAESYYDVRKSLLALKDDINGIGDDYIKNIEKASLYIEKFCERVDRGEMNALSIDDLAKTNSVIRQHDQLISDIKVKIQRGAF